MWCSGPCAREMKDVFWIVIPLGLSSAISYIVPDTANTQPLSASVSSYHHWVFCLVQIFRARLAEGTRTRHGQTICQWHGTDVRVTNEDGWRLKVGEV